MMNLTLRQFGILFVALLFSGFSVPWFAAGQVYSIRGVNVPVEKLTGAYQKAVKQYVVGAGAREPVTQNQYVAAWDAYQKELQRREQEKRQREQALRNQYRNNNRSNSYNRNTRQGATTTVKAASGLVVRDKVKPEFIDTIAIVVVPGKAAILYSDAGTFFALRSDQVLLKDGRKLPLKLKKDEDRKTFEWRSPKNEMVTVKVYDNVTLSFNEFVAQLRRGNMTHLIPELKQVQESGFGRGKSSSFGKKNGFGSSSKLEGKAGLSTRGGLGSK